MSLTRAWAMPSAETFSVSPVADFIARHLRGRSVDPFARNSRLATVRNDLNPNTDARYHERAEQFLARLADAGEQFDSALIDPPYSPRQMAECYQSTGLRLGMTGTQNARLYAEVRRQLRRLIRPGGVVLWFGWNSVGMGNGWERLETLLVCHGSAHNDTICVADRRPLMRHMPSRETLRRKILRDPDLPFEAGNPDLAKPCPRAAPPEPGGTYPLYWRVRKVRPEWFGRRCRIVTRGRRMDSRMIEFDNGERVITLGSYLRKWRLTPPDPREGNR